MFMVNQSNQLNFYSQLKFRNYNLLSLKLGDIILNKNTKLMSILPTFMCSFYAKTLLPKNFKAKL